MLKLFNDFLFIKSCTRKIGRLGINEQTLRHIVIILALDVIAPPGQDYYPREQGPRS